MTGSRYAWYALAAALFLAGCRPRAVPIRYGEDVCAHCRMVIVDARFGAELVTRTGKVYTFDSVECLAHHAAAQPDSAAVFARLVTDYGRPGRLVPVEEVFFIRSEALQSPMGGHLAAFGSGTTRRAALDAYGGRVLDWQAVRGFSDAAGRTEKKTVWGR